MLPGIRLPTGLPERAGLRPNDVVVDVVDGPILWAGPIAVGSDPAWGNGLFASVEKNGGGGARRWPLLPGLSSIEGMQIERVDDPPLSAADGDAAPRLVHGHLVVGPRRVEASNDGCVTATWDIVDADFATHREHRRLRVKDGGRVVDVDVSVLPPQGVWVRDLVPAQLQGDDGDNAGHLEGSTFGLTSSAVARRIALDVGPRWRGAWIGFDGVVRVGADEPAALSGPAASGTPGKGPKKAAAARAAADKDAVWLFTVLSEGEAPNLGNRREHANDYAAAEPASTDELVSLVSSLRPDFVRLQQRYRDDLVALSRTLRG